MVLRLCVCVCVLVSYRNADLGTVVGQSNAPLIITHDVSAPWGKKRLHTFLSLMSIPCDEHKTTLFCTRNIICQKTMW